jgi:hypothetical protein
MIIVRSEQDAAAICRKNFVIVTGFDVEKPDQNCKVPWLDISSSREDLDGFDQAVLGVQGVMAFRDYKAHLDGYPLPLPTSTRLAEGQTLPTCSGVARLCKKSSVSVRHWRQFSLGNHIWKSASVLP